MTVRLVHFTDLHFTADPALLRRREFFSKRLVGWTNLRLRRRFQAFAGTAGVVAAFVEDLAALAWDHVVFTGDVTGLALASEFETARTVLGPLADSDRVTGIPGNHDVYLRRERRRDSFGRYFGRWLRSDLAREDFPEECRRHYPFPLVRFLGETAVLYCLLDVRPTHWIDSSGRVGRRQLRALEHALSLPRAQGRFKILALHYGLRRLDGSEDGYFHRLRNADAVLRLIERTGVDLVLHGHIHRRYVLPPGEVSAAAIANPGSLSFETRERAYHLFTIGTESIELEARRYDADTETFQPWPEAPGCGTLCEEPR